MRAVAIAALAFAATGFADDTCVDDGGNWYCDAVKAIQFTNFGSSGSYSQVNAMDSGKGECSSSPKSYSGSLAPLNEEVSMHFRGPLYLKQFAVYNPSSSNHIISKNKRTVERRQPHAKRHGHGHSHFHKRREEAMEEQKRDAICDMANAIVTVVDEWGMTETWKNNYDPAGCLKTAAAASSTAAVSVAAVPTYAASATPVAASPSSVSKSQSAYTPSATGDWVQTAYYNAESGTAQGLTFLNNNGGIGSGVFDYAFGNSLSYASANGSTGAPSAQVLSNTTIPDDKEVIIMSDKSCDDGECGFYRPGAVAYHGFDGAYKVFLMEFGMPLTGTTGFNEDMPAVWMLNANIPRVIQYAANATCTCWPACGEFDIFEVLASGDTRCKATVHGDAAGGPSQYFDRPTTGTIKVAVAMLDSTANIKILDDGYNFEDSLSNTDIQSLTAKGDDLDSALALAAITFPLVAGVSG